MFRIGPEQHRESEDAPAEEGDQFHQLFRSAELGFLGLEAGSEDLVEHLDLPAQEVIQKDHRIQRAKHTVRRVVRGNDVVQGQRDATFDHRDNQ